MNRSETIIFLHIPKTAGTTLNRILQRQYRPEQIFFLGSATQDSIREYQDLASEDKERIRVVSGHTAYGFHEYVSNPSTYVSILRDPVDRVVSFYHYVKNHEQHYLNSLEANAFGGVKAFVESKITPMLDNGQTRMISGVWLEPHFGQITEQILEQAKTNLRSSFQVTGLMEQFDATLLLLQEHFKWKNVYYVRQNVSKIPPGQRNLTYEEREAVLAVNLWDVALYEYAQKLFAMQIADLGPGFTTRLESFQIRNSRRQSYREPLLQAFKRAKRFSVRASIRHMLSR